MLFYSLTSSWYEPSINLHQVFLESPEADSLENIEWLQLARPRSSPLSPLQRFDLVCGASRLGFKGHLFPMKELYVIMLYLLYGFFPFPCKWLNITSYAVLFSPQKGFLIGQFWNFVVFFLAADDLLEILLKMFDPTWVT